MTIVAEGDGRTIPIPASPGELRYYCDRVMPEWERYELEGALRRTGSDILSLNHGARVLAVRYRYAAPGMIAEIERRIGRGHRWQLFRQT